MRNRLDLAVVDAEGRPAEILAVAHDARAAHDLARHPGGVHIAVDTLQHAWEALGDVAFVPLVTPEKHRATGVDEHHLQRRGTGVYAEKDIRAVGNVDGVFDGDAASRVARAKVFVLVFAGEEGRQAPDAVCLREVRRAYRRLQLGEEHGSRAPVGCSGAVRDEQMRTVRHDRMRRIDTGSLAKRVAQGGDVLERATQQDNRALEGAPRTKPRDRLRAHSLKHAGCDVFFARAGCKQRAHVRAREHGATRGNRIGGVRAHGQPVHVAGALAHQRGHQVDEAAGPARAHRVHALFGHAAQVEELGVLAAHLQHGVSAGATRLDRPLQSDDFLDEANGQKLGHAHAGAARDARLDLAVPEAPRAIVNGLDKRVFYLGAVPCIALADHLAVCRDQRELDGFRPYVDPEPVWHPVRSSPPSAPFAPPPASPRALPADTPGGGNAT